MREFTSELPQRISRPNTHSQPLPAYRGILAVDAKGFTGRPAIEHEAVSRVVPELLKTALFRAELQDLWEDRTFPASTGDGYIFGFDPTRMPFVIHPLLLMLQDVLTDYNVLSYGAVPIRLRASVHVGPLPDTRDEFSGNGTARNDTHRLLDSRPVKAVLASHKEKITHVAAILSDRCYEDAVASGYTGRHLDHFVEVAATVEGKPFSQRAWIYVPQPSGPLYEEVPDAVTTVEPTQEGATAQAHDDTPAPQVRNSAPHGNLNTGTVHGGQSVANRHVAGDYVEGNKAGRVRGFQGDQVRGNKYQGRQ
ncbi:hypothetical protein [Streptomyces candidus]|uniref:Uncharacterized protein n=1 Tax=Streptomyces candidus TaxID=67283 RepID=A0A7X0LRJ6_9ACTN|nr:hypothetical protein [Streptomyces candidus]MBB6438177.1 hypothetical protein [Streptomyces candidus]GHH39035.1 hypothetical protein GCM10018773_18190 [Streptomyces candidus]